MKNETKIFIVIAIVICVFFGGMLTEHLRTKARDRKRIAELEATIGRLEGELQSQIAKANTIRSRYENLGRELAESQRRSEQRISEYIQEISGYKNRVRQLIDGYAADIEIFDGVDRTVRILEEKIRQLGETEQDP